MKRKQETLADRFLKLKGGESFNSLSDRMARAGISVSPQGVHKWSAGGGMPLEKIEEIAKFFGVSPSWLAFGEEIADSSDLSPHAMLLARALMKIPERFRKELERDILTLATAYTNEKSEPNLAREIKNALATKS